MIDALCALSDGQRALPLVIAPPEYQMPTEATAIRYMPADALLARGPVILITTSRLPDAP